MKKWSFPLLIGSVLLVASVGCKKAPPETPSVAPSPPVSPPAAPPEVAPPPAVTTVDEQPKPLDGEILAADEHARSTGLIGDVYFAFDKYDLSDSARDRLSKNATFLKERGDFVVTIEGHCDERGTIDYNIALGDRRANAARDYLESLGVSSSRLRTLSYGEVEPVCTSSDESCWSQNRRAEFHLTGRM